MTDRPSAPYTQRMRATPAAAVAVIAGLLVASGCAGSHRTKTSIPTGPTPIVRTSPSKGRPLVVPTSPNAMRRLKRHLRGPRFLSPTRLAIPGIAGSSNCPSVPVKLIVQRPHAIRIDLVVGSWNRTASGLRVRVPRSPGLCLQDLVPTPVVLSINPRQIDVHHRLRVSLYYPEGVIRRYERPVVGTVPPL